MKTKQNDDFYLTLRIRYLGIRLKVIQDLKLMSHTRISHLGARVLLISSVSPCSVEELMRLTLSIHSDPFSKGNFTKGMRQSPAKTKYRLKSSLDSHLGTNETEIVRRFLLN